MNKRLINPSFNELLKEQSKAISAMNKRFINPSFNELLKEQSRVFKELKTRIAILNSNRNDENTQRIKPKEKRIIKRQIKFLFPNLNYKSIKEIERYIIENNLIEWFILMIILIIDYAYIGQYLDSDENLAKDIILKPLEYYSSKEIGNKIKLNRIDA